MDDREDLLLRQEYSAIGKRLPRVDGVIKAIGSAQYTSDLLFPGMLYGKILRSPYPHARILNVDVSKVKSLLGVRAVITGKDTPAVKYNNLGFPQFDDEYALAIDKVRFIGDEIAAVAAVDEDIAEEALDLIKVEYEELPPVFDPEKAMEEGAPQIHDHAERNIASKTFLDYGDIEKGFKEADHIFEDIVLTQPVIHATLETHAVIADYDSSGRLTVWATTQTPYMTRRDLARVLNIPIEKIRVIKPCLGSGLGGKHDMLALEPCAALLSKKSGKPVRIMYTRDEEFMTARTRHPMKLKLKTGIKKDGTLVAIECVNIVDNGAYNSHGPAIVAAGGTEGLATVYRIPNIRYDANLVYTNNPPGTAFRGFGILQVRYAVDVHLDNIAKELGMDVVTIMKKNAVHSGDVTAKKSKITSCGLTECIEKTAKESGWQDKRLRGKDPSSSGIGIGCMVYVSGGKIYYPHDASSAFVKIGEDGTITIYSGSSDIGQGSDTTLCQIAAEVFKVPLEDVRIVSSDTETTPMDLGTYANRVTFMAGNAVKAAALDAREQLLDFIADTMEASLSDLEMKNRRIYVKGSPERGMSLAEAATAALYSEKGVSFLGRGYYNPPTDLIDYVKGIGNVSPAYTFGAETAEIEIDRETGRVKVMEIHGAADVGIAINPMSIEGQMEGCVSVGMGQALYENLHREKGLTLNPSFLEYKVPTTLEMPKVNTIIVETNDPEGPFGAKGFSEGCQVPTAPAIVNAICDALGVKVQDLPITPDKVLDRLRK